MINVMTLEQLAELVQGTVFNPEPQAETFSSVSKDTRSLQKGDLYIALRGDNFDGHQFLTQALEKQAVAALVEKIDESVLLPQVQVESTLLALGQLAEHNREQFTGTLVAETGSAGKTTVKQLMASVLSQEFNTLMTQGNLNNHIGAPLTLLEINKDHTTAVIELGASAEGDIEYTAQWVKPQVGIITNVAASHISEFGSLLNIVKTKGELLDFIQAEGIAVLNADDEFFTQWQSDRKSTRLNSSHVRISYAVFCLKKKK